jgi:hypothetical protein
MKLEERIKLITDDDCFWDWDGSNLSYTANTPDSKWGSTTKFDPFPCYSHKKELVEETARIVENRFPIKFNTFYFLFPFEPLSRTNGQASYNTITYDDRDTGSKGTWDGIIHLYGKRIPLHPAMTRYLVAHEYGHIVDYWICNRRGLQHDGIDEEYAKLRGIDNNQKYGGRKWHTNVGEIIANDFRITVCNIESEFWPHEVPHPKDCPQVNDFWYKMMLEYGNG